MAVAAEFSDVAFNADREESLRIWLEEVDQNPPAGLQSLALLGHWVRACQKLCQKYLPSAPVVQKARYNPVTGQNDPEQLLGHESMAERMWPVIWKYAPIGHFLFVRRIPPAEETKGGLLIPKTAQQANHRGWVLNVGPEVGNPNLSQAPYGCPIRNPLDLVGRVVTWGAYAGTTLVEQSIDSKWDGEYLEISIAEVLAIEIDTER